MLERIDETIVAISSAAGCGALGIVRVSGPAAIELAEATARLAPNATLGQSPGFRRLTGEVELDVDLRLPAYFYVFRAPKSYTRQNMVEVHTVGSPVVLEMLRQRFIALGARPAEPGEFTARAFLNGALDLASAEAVAGIIRAQSDSQLRAARRVMDGALAKLVIRFRDELATLLALVEADIDFAEEPIEFITPNVLAERLNSILFALQPLLNSAASYERQDRLPCILLLGPPNSGKSSLMNRLSGTSRAICAAVAGTTRDILSAVIRIGRGEAILLDAAGVDQSPDEILRKARAMTLERAQQVDLVCMVLDASEVNRDPSYFGEFREALGSVDRAPQMAACNKCDLVEAPAIEPMLQLIADQTGVRAFAVSAVTGQGVDELRAAFADVLGDVEQTASSDAIVLNHRQCQAMIQAADAITRACELCVPASEIIECADLVAFELREALDQFAAVTGAVTTEDLLGQVFADFCIGK
ncbi:MAG: tRNA modification GTPase [Planctomycetes bacterium]|nr:tRNA modification GTPase [Planctomycetota bacterium]